MVVSATSRVHQSMRVSTAQYTSRPSYNTTREVQAAHCTLNTNFHVYTNSDRIIGFCHNTELGYSARISDAASSTLPRAVSFPQLPESSTFFLRRCSHCKVPVALCSVVDSVSAAHATRFKMVWQLSISTSR